MLASCLSVAEYAKDMKAPQSREALVDLARSVKDQIDRFGPWKYREAEGQITAVADYTTGTVAVTQGSTSVTFTGSTLKAAMASRQIRIGGSSRWYEFRSVDTAAGTAVLLDPYEGGTETAASFIIRQRYYRPPPDMDKAIVGKETGGQKIIWWRSREEFEASMGVADAGGNAQHIVPAGATRTALYATGTVTMTFGSTTVTGAGTTFADDRDRGRKLRLPLSPKLGDFIVQYVNSATELVIDRNWREPTISAQLYEIDPAGTPLVELYPSPGDGNQSLRLYYYRILPPLYLETDIPNWHEDMHDVWKQATLLRAITLDPEVWEQKFSTLMGNFAKRNGYEFARIIRQGRWGMWPGTNPPSNLPWNYPSWLPGRRW